jgi:uncharacterized protein YcbX
VATVTRIAIAPVKGLGLQHPEAVEVTPTGVLENRRLHLINAGDFLINDKTLMELMLIGAELDLQAGRLTLRFPDGTVAEGPLTLGAPIVSNVFRRRVPGRLIDGPFAAALSRFAGIDVRVVMSDPPGAAIDRGVKNAISIISGASIGDIARAGGAEALDGRRFRMLFEIDGVEPYEEESWLGREVRIGDAVVRPLGNVGRCAITTRDPDTAEKDFDTLKVLARHRADVETTEPLPLGVSGEVVSPGAVRLGDTVSLV